MTWSIVARDPLTGLFGIAAASRFFALGALVPHASPHGALATQALVNPTYGPRGLRLLAEGVPAERALEILVELDEGRDQRQLHIIDRHGRNAAWTGRACVGWHGQIVTRDLSLAGNMLTGAEVLEASRAAYEAGAGASLPERLLQAMEAGEAAGGDSRGRQSAVLLIWGQRSYPLLSMRVDDHPQPLPELRRLYVVAKERFLPFSTAFSGDELDCGITDRAMIEQRIGAGLRPPGL